MAGVLLVAAAVAAGLLLNHSDNASRQAVGGGYHFERPSRVFARRGVAYPLCPKSTSTSAREAEARQSGGREVFTFALTLKRPAKSVVVSFDGLTTKLNAPRVRPGARLPSGFKPRTGEVFAGNLATASLLKLAAHPTLGTNPVLGHAGPATFVALITYPDGTSITTSFRQRLNRGWQ